MTFFTTKRKEFDRCINHLYTIYDDIDSLEKNLNELTIEISNNYNNDIKKTLAYSIICLSSTKDDIQELSKLLEKCVKNYQNAEQQILTGTFTDQANANKTSQTETAEDTSNTDQISTPKNGQDNWLTKADAYMDAINNVINHISSLSETIHQAIQDASDLDAVVAIGLSGSIGGGGYLGGAIQLVIDMDGNVGIQFSGGAGSEAGLSADGTAYVAVYPRKKNITDIEGFGIETGGSLGEGFVGSASLLLDGEGDQVSPSGFLIGLGLGGEGTIGEGHVAMSETFPTLKLGNVLTRPIDKLVCDWNIIYKAWKFIR